MTFSAFTTVAGNGKAGYSVDGDIADYGNNRSTSTNRLR